jgi:broad specificity phosphatase PhoE
MRILLVRHAEPDYSTDSLTPAGVREAEALGRRLGKQGVDRLFCSPLGRARETASHIARNCKLDPTVLTWTAELNDLKMDPKKWEHHMVWDLHGEHIRAQAPWPTQENWNQFEPFTETVADEEYARIQNASDAWIAELGYVREGGRYRIVKSHRDTVCLACHGGFGLTWLAHLLELPVPMVWTGFFMPCSSVTTILFDERSKDWAVPRVIGLGDISHLYEAGLPMSSMGIKANTH